MSNRRYCYNLASREILLTSKSLTNYDYPIFNSTTDSNSTKSMRKRIRKMAYRMRSLLTQIESLPSSNNRLPHFPRQSLVCHRLSEKKRNGKRNESEESGISSQDNTFYLHLHSTPLSDRTNSKKSLSSTTTTSTSSTSSNKLTSISSSKKQISSKRITSPSSSRTTLIRQSSKSLRRTILSDNHNCHHNTYESVKDETMLNDIPVDQRTFVVGKLPIMTEVRQRKTILTKRKRTISRPKFVQLKNDENYENFNYRGRKSKMMKLDEDKMINIPRCSTPKLKSHKIRQSCINILNSSQVIVVNI
ncbi:hypothetical protein SNEBB_008617 [Seison nebaliae]|nr:hypothetical protein SNEBB_008617 [Seison nebaliae]